MKLGRLCAALPACTLFCSTPAAKQTALLEALRADDRETVQTLLDSGADPGEAEERRGEVFARPIFYAVTSGNASLVRRLLDSSGRMEDRGWQEMTPLMEAARTGQEEVLLVLIAKGARLDATDRLGRTALIWAAIAGHENCVNALLEAGADPQLKDDSGRGPQGYAVLFNRKNIAMLIKNPKQKKDKKQ